MEKPHWQRRASHYIVDSPYMRLRADEVELPGGAIVSNYYVRESRGFVVIVALTPSDDVVLVRQYRYGADSIHLELPAGMLLDEEEPRDCALRELAEETGYAVETCDFAAQYFPEPVRSTARAYIFVATGARKVREPAPDPTEHLEVELVPVGRLRAMLADGRVDTGASIAAGYLVLDRLARL
ncbi:MAG: NUDIX hydrolase [Candidatus Eremiobacteraeota bacterium]|nr:NUDIX hydrolase [Candidatus Eremiobacteraeota bacterium]